MSEKSFSNTRIQSVKVALSGIKYVLTTQPNARIHAGFTLAVFLVAGLLKLPRQEWIILVLTVGLVWTAEVFNTAVEIAVDVVSPSYDSRAKTIKDISAGAVLISVLVSILVGLFIFGPHLWNWILSLF